MHVLSPQMLGCICDYPIVVFFVCHFGHCPSVNLEVMVP